MSFKLLKGSIFKISLALGAIENDFRTLYRGIFSDFSIYASTKRYLNPLSLILLRIRGPFVDDSKDPKLTHLRAENLRHSFIIFIYLFLL